MCLAIPVRIVSIDGDEAEADIGGVRRNVSIALTPGVKVGDYVLWKHGAYGESATRKYEVNPRPLN